MLLRSAEPTCEADNKATPLFARFAPLGRMSGRSLVDVRARDRGGSTLGSFWPAFRLVRHLATGHQHRNPIVTFMMVFVIQNTQSRDTQADAVSSFGFPGPRKRRPGAPRTTRSVVECYPSHGGLGRREPNSHTATKWQPFVFLIPRFDRLRIAIMPCSARCHPPPCGAAYEWLV